MAVVIIVLIIAFFTIITCAGIPSGKSNYRKRYNRSLWNDVPSPAPLPCAEPEAPKERKPRAPRRTVKFEDETVPVMHMYVNEKGEIVETYHDLTSLPGWSMI